MKADTTRSTFKQTKHYHSVRMQQGRVQIDADWNEQMDIIGHRITTEAIDVIGNSGAPLHDPGFHLVAQAADLSAEEKTLPENQTPPAIVAGDLLISGGRYYVDGILCENDRIIPYTKQPDYPNQTPVATAGTYLAYLDVWSRHLTALDDASIREVALGGPDTATRAKTIWQVKLFRVGAANLAADCSTAFGAWDTAIAPGTGKLAARTEADPTADTPCIVKPGAGYRRLENQHYRVEVHDPGPRGTATFKWSRENGSVVTNWESKTLNQLTVGSIGRDKVLNFASGQWIELLDDNNELLGTPGTLVQLIKAEGNVLTIDEATKTGSTDLAAFPSNAKVRRWDMVAPLQPTLKPTNDNWVPLEDGVQVQFTAGSYKTGDYWLIPARTATANVEWPVDPISKQPVQQLPAGIRHHYCRLAVLKNDGTKWTSITDCRHLFPPLTDLLAFEFAGGDGQEAMPDLTDTTKFLKLPRKLEAAVTNDRIPVPGAAVKFTVLLGNGKLQGGASPQTVLTDARGIAACEWSLDSITQSQQVEAVLLDPTNSALTVCAPIHYQANLSIASQVAYDPDAACLSLKSKKTVQEAIDTLAALASLYPVSGDDQVVKPTANLEPLVVVAASKCGPAAGMKVIFTIISGGGKISPLGGVPGPGPVTILTDLQGMASCDWKLGGGPGVQIVEAVLQAGPNPVVPPLSVQFTAQNQGAVDEPGFHVVDLELLAPPNPLKNNLDVKVPDLSGGLRVDCDDTLDPAALFSKHPIGNPVCFVTVEVPFPVPEAQPVPPIVGFQSIILAANVKANQKSIQWKPTPDAIAFLKKLFPFLKDRRILARLHLKGNFIWTAADVEVYLDGELFLFKNQDQLLFPSGDRRRGGNMEMWFWIVPGAGVQLTADAGTSIVSGTVKDGTGRPIVAAKVNLTALAPPNPVKTAVTNAVGSYEFINVESGGYNVSVNVDGESAVVGVVVGKP